MPQYQSTPFKPQPELLVAGRPSYVWGSYNDRTGPTQGNVISNSSVGTLATLTFLVTAGNIPTVGSLITVVGCARSANFNVTNATVLSVSTTDQGASGVVTVTYNVTTTTIGTGVDGGQVIIPQPEIGEALVNGASVPVAKVFNNAIVDQSEIITVAVSFPIIPKAATIILQEALVDLDSEYSNIAVVATVANSTIGGSVVVPTSIQVAGRFYRLWNEGVVGIGTIVGKILG
jgi:hypothetical protein